MLVVAGSRNRGLGQRVASLEGFSICGVEQKVFPDGEIYLRLLSSVKGKDCLVVQSNFTNDDFVELILLLDMLHDQGAASVDAFVPYLGYARQDKIFQQGESLSAKTILKQIKGLCRNLYTVNCHLLANGGKQSFQGMEIVNLDAFPLLASTFGSKLASPYLVAIDKGSLIYAKNAAKSLDCGFGNLEKTRISSEEVSYSAKGLEVQGKDVIIIDDIISTGGTIITAAGLLRGQGAASINVGCVHGVFSKGVERVEGATDLLVCTDTLSTLPDPVSVAPLLASAIKDEEE